MSYNKNNITLLFSDFYKYVNLYLINKINVNLLIDMFIYKKYILNNIQWILMKNYTQT